MEPEQESPKRKYHPVWAKLIANPGVVVKVKAANPKRVRKAVWKEKDLDQTKDSNGELVKKLWRLTCTLDEKAGILIFKLVPATHLANI